MSDEHPIRDELATPDDMPGDSDGRDTTATDAAAPQPEESSANEAPVSETPAEPEADAAPEPEVAPEPDPAPEPPAEPPAAAAPEPAGPAPVVAPAKEPGFEWYVLRVQSGREDSIANNLTKKLALTKMDHYVKEVVVPKQKVTEIKEGKKRTRKQKLYPGYVFVHANLEDDLWYLIRDTSGIGDFVGSGAKPVPMLESEVRKILEIMEEKEEAQQVHIDLSKNDTVKIIEGPFENFDGVVEEVNPTKGIVRVMVTIFGRSTPVDLEYWQIEKL